MSPFSVGDVLATGIGVDVAGAVTFGRGLFLSAPDRVGRLARAQNSFAALRIGEAESHADAVVGGGALIVGLLIQAVGYALVTGGARASSTADGAAALALIFMLLGAGTVAATSRFDRLPRTKRYLVTLAQYAGGRRLDAPELHALVRFADTMGYERTPAELEGYEGASRYVRRVFGVTTTVGWGASGVHGYGLVKAPPS
jgi:hypothetical protein